MVVSALLLSLASLSAYLVLQRLLREGDARCLAAFSPLLACQWLILCANWTPHTQRIWVAAGWGGLCLALYWIRPSATPLAPLSRSGKIGVALGLLAALGYTHYCQLRFLDTDNWIHEPMIASYMKGVFPPVHPFFPEIAMNGHYGRDLLVSFLTPNLADPLGTVWVLNLVLQGCAFAGLFALGHRFTQCYSASLALALCVFFGICVGVRTGMIDTFDGNNGVVYALLVPLIYLLGRVLELDSAEETSPPLPQRLALWGIAGVTLGGYQLVYETHFGLLFLTGLSAALILRRPRRVWLGLLVVAALSLGLACVEGGPFTDMAKRRLAPPPTTAQASEAQQNKGQHVSLSFPKKELLKVLVTTADYQRMSVAFSTRWFSAWRPRLSGEGYMAIYDPRFWYAHWLPLYLCPLTLLLLWRGRKESRLAPLGLVFWLFGAWAFLVPALVDFGPLYELEYFRWEFAAGWGWAGALGLALGHPLQDLSSCRPRLLTEEGGWVIRWPRPFLKVLACGALLAADLAAGEKLLNDALVDVQRGQLQALPTSLEWRLAQKDLGVEAVDAEAAQWVAPQVVARDRLLTNLGNETPAGLWPDCVWATWTGALPAGRAHPPGTSRHHAHPNFYRDGLAKALNSTGRLEMAQAAKVRWLVLDPARLAPVARQALEGTDAHRKIFGGGAAVRWVYDLPPLAPSSGSAASDVKVEATVDGDLEELRKGRRYPVRIKLGDQRVGPLTARVVAEDGTDLEQTPLTVYPEGMEIEHSLVTPWEEGSFRWVLESNGRSLVEIPFQVTLEKRLAALRARLDLPDHFLPKHFYSLRLGLTSPRPIRAAQDLWIYWRLRHEGGDYVWDLDSIPQPIDLDLQADQEKLFSLQFLTPAQKGTYLPEILVKDRTTGAEVPLQLDSGPVRVP